MISIASLLTIPRFEDRALIDIDNHFHNNSTGRSSFFFFFFTSFDSSFNFSNILSVLERRFFE